MTENFKYDVLHELREIAMELRRSNDLKEKQLKQEYFLIELIEEVLPLDDIKKRHCHQRAFREY